MNTDKFEYEIFQLTSDFYSTYPDPPYREILQKTSRAYNCLFIHVNTFYICIPYRSEITHKYSYTFKKSKRAKYHKSGLDYTKIVIIRNLNYINESKAIIDQDEYNETRINIAKIKKEAQEFVEAYINHINKKKILSEQEFKRRYQYSSLKYFHSELGIQNI